MTIRAVLVDDEANVRQHLRQQLANAWPEIEIIGEAGNATEAEVLITDVEPDIAFLDIHMPGRSGLELARAINGACAIVFVTAFDEHALAAFDAAAIDYVLKPASRERLAETRERFASRQPKQSRIDLDALAEALQAKHTTRLTWLRAGRGDEVELVAVDDVVYFRAEAKYTSAFTPDAEHLLRISLSELEKSLDPEQFWRIHRSLIVRVDQIAKASRDLRGRYVLKLRDRKESLRTSPTYSHLFRQM